jgi:hypothetical protein
MAKARKKTTSKKTRRPKTAKKKPRAARKPKVKRRATTAKKRAPSRTRATRRTPAKRKPAAKRLSTPARSAAPRPLAASPSGLEPRTGLAADVMAALRGRGHEPGAEVVESIATVCAGYRKGPATDSPLGIPFDADVEVAREFADRFLKGVPPAVLDREMHRHTVRSTVEGDLARFEVIGVGESARETLTSLCLGAWDPATDENAKRNAIAGFVVRWYREGLE